MAPGKLTVPIAGVSVPSVGVTAERIATLAGSVLGSAVLAELGGRSGDLLATVGAGTGGRRYRSDAPHVRFPLARRPAAAPASETEPHRDEADPFEDDAVLLRRVGNVVEDFGFGPFAPWRSAAISSAQIVEELRPVAAKLAEADIDWWWAQADTTSQRCVGEVVLAAEAGRAAVLGAAARWPSPDRWWSSVVDMNVLRSTRGPVAGTAAVALACHDGHEVWHEGEPVLTVRVQPGARIREIGQPQAWVDLVAEYPARLPAGPTNWTQWTGWAGEWLQPDWTAVAEDWDGVHVSLAAHLTTAYRLLQVGQAATFLAGWNPDETLWLGQAATVDPGSGAG
jgi:hypothetical protein